MSLKSEIKSYLKKKLGVPEIPTSLERLSKLGFKPKLIFDVGAYKGDFTNLCLNYFPDTSVSCFEVLDDRLAQLNSIASKNSKVRVFPTLLGASIQDKVIFNQAETASSVLTEHIPKNFPVKSCPMTTVDNIVAEHLSGQVPEFLKLDVQGYELEVLKGCEKSFPEIQVILAEISLIDIHQNVPLLAEMVKWLDERNWCAYDICGLTRRPLDQALWQADFIFVPQDSKFRKDKRWGV